jgi:two-component system response regulator HydG
MSATILLVDDDEDTRALLGDLLRNRGYSVELAESAAECLERVKDTAIDIVVTDIQMPGMSGIALCSELHDRHPDVLSIVLTGIGDVDNAIAAIRAGAHDFLIKPASVDALQVSIDRALAHLSVKREVKRLRAASAHEAPIPTIIGTSAALRETTRLIRQVADSDATVLITGESGTGKELVARSLHDLSRRSSQPFVAINCGAMPPALLESELFGHVRGAFTDAKTSRQGLFLQAGNGTIFLDEIGEMPLEMQVKLLRVLQQRTVRPVGGDDEVPFAARVITATNRDLATEVEEKRFREDLYYRINVVAIPVPPLRERAVDVVVLARHMLDRIAKRQSKAALELSSEAGRKLTEYDWPGNVRELENSIERAVAMCGNGPIEVEHLPKKIQEFQSTRIELNLENTAEMITLEEMEKRYVRQVLDSVRGNKTHAARVLGIDRRSLYRRLEGQTLPPGIGDQR